MQVKTILKTGLRGEAERSFLRIFRIILLRSEKRGIMVGILSREGMILDDGRREDYQILLVPHQIVLVLIVTRLDLPGRVDKGAILVQSLRWGFVDLSMIDLLPRLVDLNKVLSHSILVWLFLQSIGKGILLVF